MSHTKKEIASKMKTSYKTGRHQLEKRLASYLEDFAQHGEDRHQENMWRYARLNPMSDKRIF